MIENAAILASVILFVLGIFQVLLVAGAPIGRFAWGGAHTVLPRKLRIGSVFSIFLYIVFAIIILEQSGLISVIKNTAVTGIGIWVITVYSFVGIIMNALSRSKPERFVMTPTAALLAVLFYIVASDT